MTVKTRSELRSENAADFPNNQTRLISPADLRGQMDDIADSALLAEDIPGLDVSQAVVTATGDGTQTLGDWMGDLDGGEGSVGLGVDGMAQLRLRPVVNGQTVRLNYHTTSGDYGSGLFRGATTGGPYTDNDGTVITPSGGDGSEAWVRIWDGVKAHVGWFGAACAPMDLASDDYLAVKKCFGLFTSERTALRTGIVDVGPGFCFSQPLIYGGSGQCGFKLVGMHSNARGGQEPSLVRYTGPETIGAIIFYGANQWYIEDINTYPGSALNGIIITADNSYNNSHSHTTTHAITAGSNVVVMPSGANAAQKIIYLQPGCFLGVDAGGDNFEIVYITAVDTTAGTFTADFAKNHASGVMLGGGAPSSSGRVNSCRLLCQASPIWTTLTANSVQDANTVFTVADIAGIAIGEPVRVGSFLYAEIVYPKSIDVGAGTFVATSAYGHFSGEIVMYPTAGIMVGNRLTGTVQVDNIWMYDTTVTGFDVNKSYAGFRQMWGGNVKAFVFHAMTATNMRVGFACEQASGQYLISGGTSAGLTETLVINASGSLTVTSWEDESACLWLVGSSGSNPAAATFIGCSFQGQAPADYYDQMVVYGGNLTFIGCGLKNRRDATSLPIISVTGLRQGAGAGSVALINCAVANARPSTGHMNFVQDVPLPSGGGVDIIKDGTGKFTMLNCIGGASGSLERLPNIVPPLDGWQGTATYDPPSLPAGVVDTAQTMTVTGAVLGDLVEASFSLDLQGIALRAWVSAANAVKYQFSCPTGGATVDLGSGTVKCRVKK